MGTTERLCELFSESGRKYNEKVCVIVDHWEGRLAVRIVDGKCEGGKEMRVKPIKMRPVCSGCHEDTRNQHLRGRWSGTAEQPVRKNTGGITRRRAPSLHRARLQEGTVAWWTTRCGPAFHKPQRRALRDYHTDYGCSILSPVLVRNKCYPPGPCFLVSYPTKRFMIETSDIPSFLHRK